MTQLPWRQVQSRLKIILPRLPYKIGTIMVNFSKDRFIAQNWVDEGYQMWPRRKMNKRNRGRAILVKTGRLRRSIRIISVSRNYVTIGSDVPYAQAHNEGFTGSVSVRQHKRRRTGKAEVFSIKSRKKKNVKVDLGDLYVKSHSRQMSLPQRQFMGPSRMLSNRLTREIEKEIQKAFKQ